MCSYQETLPVHVNIFSQCIIISNKIYSIYLPKNVIHFFGTEPPIIIGQVVSLYQQRLLFPYITIRDKFFFNMYYRD